ncbi:MAG: hypothetical protein RL208_355, partial [Pseudomonadota bacterium]
IIIFVLIGLIIAFNHFFTLFIIRKQINIFEKKHNLVVNYKIQKSLKNIIPNKFILKDVKVDFINRELVLEVPKLTIEIQKVFPVKNINFNVYTKKINVLSKKDDTNFRIDGNLFLETKLYNTLKEKKYNSIIRLRLKKGNLLLFQNGDKMFSLDSNNISLQTHYDDLGDVSYNVDFDGEVFVFNGSNYSRIGKMQENNKIKLDFAANIQLKNRHNHDSGNIVQHNKMLIKNLNILIDNTNIDLNGDVYFIQKLDDMEIKLYISDKNWFVDKLLKVFLNYNSDSANWIIGKIVGSVSDSIKNRLQPDEEINHIEMYITKKNKLPILINGQKLSELLYGLIKDYED